MGSLWSRVGVVFASASIASAIVAMAIGIVMIGWIEPSELGLWQSLSILTLYIPFMEAGVPNGLNRDLPFLTGRGDERLGLAYAQTALAYMTIVSLFLLVATIIATAVMVSMKADLMVVSGVFTVGALLTINAYQRYLAVTYRSSESFISLSKLYVVQIVAQLVTFPLVWFYKYYGLLIYTIVVPAVFTMAMHLRRPLKIQGAFNLSHFSHLVKTGFPVFVMGYLRGVSSSFSRIVLLGAGGVLMVGLFTPVNALGSLITLLPSVLANFFFPRMNLVLGATNDRSKLWPLVVKINLILFAVALPFVASVWVAAPYVISTFFEKYQSAIPAVQVFSLNFIFSGTPVSHNVIYAVKAYSLGYIFVAAELLMKLGLPFLFVKCFDGNPLTLVVYGLLLANCLLFFLNIYFIKRALSVVSDE